MEEVDEIQRSLDALSSLPEDDQGVTVAEFHLSDDPEKQPGLVWTIPAGVAAAETINRYDFRDRKVRCVVCHAARHNRGVTVRLTNSAIVLMGHDCVDLFFGAGTWQRLETEFQSRIDEAFYKKHLSGIAASLPALISRIERCYQQAQRFDAAYMEWKEASPEAVEALSKAAREREGRIGFVREASNPQFGHVSGAPPTIFVTDEVGQLAGAALFASFRTTFVARELSSRLTDINSRLESSGFTNHKARLLSIDFQKLSSDLGRAEEMFSLVDQAVGPGNKRLMDLVRARSGQLAA